MAAKKKKKRVNAKPAAARMRAREIRKAAGYITGALEARKIGASVRLSKGKSTARVKCSSSPVAVIFVAAATRWDRHCPDLSLAELAQRALLEVELGPDFIDRAITTKHAARPELPLRDALELVAIESRAAIFASRRRRFGSCFRGSPC